MATVKTYDETKRSIFEAMATRNVRAGDIVSWPDLQRQLQPRLRGGEIEDAFNHMIAEGLITYTAGSKFITLTDKGYAEM